MNTRVIDIRLNSHGLTEQKVSEGCGFGRRRSDVWSAERLLTKVKAGPRRSLIAARHSAVVCWLSGYPEGGAIRMRRIEANDAIGGPAVIAETDISRSSGFPRVAQLGNEVYFAWMEFGKPSKVRLPSVIRPNKITDFPAKLLHA